MSNHKTIYKKTSCPLDCPDTCGLIAAVENNKVVSLAGDQDHPYTRGVICRKMKSYHDRLYSKDRVLHPMKRAGRKGSGKFKRIGWDEAYSTLAEKLTSVRDVYGGEAILPFVYAGNMGAVNRFAGYPLFHKLGTSRLIETICSTTAKAGWQSNCGDVPGTPPEVAEDAKLIIIWGSNTKVTNMHFWPYVATAKKKGAKLVVVDPYRNITAASAHMHIQVKPGGDSALALGVLKILLEKNALDTDFLQNSTQGFERLANYLNRTPLPDFATQSGIPIQQIEDFARLLKINKKSFIRIGIGLTRNSRAGMSLRAITSLAAALGLFDGDNGRGVLMTSGAFKGDQEKLVWSSLAEKETRRFNIVQLGKCLQTATPPIRLLMVYNANPLSVTPDGSMVRQALADESLFTVVHEQVLTPTARYADLLLPATTFLENSDVYTAYGHFYMAKADAVVEPCGEAKSNFTFFQELAEKMGFTDQPFKQSLEERITDYLNTLVGLPEEVDVDDLSPGNPILSTSSRTGVPLFSKSTVKYNFTQEETVTIPAHACLIDGDEFDDADYLTRFPLKLITPPHIDLLNSTFGERYQGQTGQVLIHPADAEKFKVADKETVTLYNNRGWSRRIAKVTDDTQEGLLVAEGIFWQYDDHPSGINDLTSQKLTDMGGGGTFHESRVSIGEGF